MLEALFLGAFVVVSSVGWVRLFMEPNAQVLWVAPGALVGWLVADLISGCVHFLADNFGSTETPIFGRTLIAAFREHHINPKQMLEHGFLERNGWNCGGACVLGLPTWFSDGSGEWHFFSPLLLTGALFVATTNQIHAWAHSPRRPWLVRAFQSAGIILQPRQHALHHRHVGPASHVLAAIHAEGSLRTRFARGHYCITSGVWDRLLGGGVLRSPSTSKR